MKARRIKDRPRPIDLRTFLLDTNVVSEWTKSRPNTGVVTWLEEVDEDRVFVSVITFAELRHGLERMPAGRQGTTLCNP